MVNLQEAFSKLNMMESGDFKLLDKDEKDAMKSFLEDDDEFEAEEVDIIDPQADDDIDLQDSYVGKIIVQCPVCKSLIYKTQEEIDEMGDEEQSCPYCFSVEKFDLIGKVVPIEDETAPEIPAEEENVAEPEVTVESKEECCPDCGKPMNECDCGKEDLHEDLENVTIETEDEVINVSATPKDEPVEDIMEEPTEATEDVPEEHEDAEVIAPLDDELGNDLGDNDSDEIEEIDEESFDRFAESFLKENYSNIVSYKTNKVKDCGKYMIAEGVVTLKNNDKKLTEFKIRPSVFSKDGKGSCLVENLQLKKRTIINSVVK